jgi:putative membrane protein
VLTLGLFIFVINGLLFWAVGSFVEGFHVGGFWSGVFGAIVYSLISWLLSALLPQRRDWARPHPRTSRFPDQ